MSEPRGFYYSKQKQKTRRFLPAGLKNPMIALLALIGLRRHADRMMMVVMAMGQGNHEEFMLARAQRRVNQKNVNQKKQRQPLSPASPHSIRIAADAATSQNVLDGLHQIGRRVAENEVRSGNFR